MLRWIGDYLSPDKKQELTTLLSTGMPIIGYSPYDWDMNKRYEESAEAPASSKIESPQIEDNSQVIVPCPGYKIIGNVTTKYPTHKTSSHKI
jgi:hypothetical protein